MKNKYRFKTDQEYIDILTQANEAYYNDADTFLSDAEYDAIRDEFESRFPDHDFNKVVGASVKASTLPKAKHSIPMGSQAKVKTFEELKDWYEKVCKKLNAKPSLVWSEKLDGFSLSPIYKEGKVVQGITRGDGVIGEDITFNITKIQNIPKKTPDKLSFSARGEAMLKKVIFNKHFTDKANPRNAAAGVAKRLDGVRTNFVNFLCYDIVSEDGLNFFQTEFEKLTYIQTLGFKTPKFGVVKTLDEIQKTWEAYESKEREASDFELDGLVITINEIEHQKTLGIIDQRPRYSRAYKFSSQRGQTIVEAIEWKAGRSGRITPVATLAPISLAGVTIVHATLHNLSELKRLKITPGATVEIKRAGDVIPKIESVLTPSKTKLKIPTNCPACGEPTTQKEKFLMCENLACSAKHYENLLHWVKTLEIRGFGDELVHQLNDAKLLSTPADFYKLSIEDISALDRRGEKSATKLLTELNNKKEITFPLFIKALGILNFSDKTAELVQPTFQTIEQLKLATKEELLMIHGIGEVVAEAIVSGLKERKKLISDLLKYITIKPYNAPKKGKFTGKSFCFTGVRDKNLEQMIVQQGGKISSGVSKELTYLVARDPEENSSKLKKARDAGVKILSLQEAQSLFN